MCTVYKCISCIIGHTHLMCRLCVLLLYRGRQRSSSRPSPPRLALTRVQADEAYAVPCRLAGWLLSWCGGRIFMKICMPPRRCLLSQSGSRVLPRRYLPN